MTQHVINDVSAQLMDLIVHKTATVGVMGLGYVGLPLIDAFQRAGFSTLGFDIDRKKADALNRGQSYIAHIPSASIQRWRDSKKFEATTDFERLDEPDVILICVPTPLNESRDPDLQFIEATVRAIAKRLRSGQLVVLESTTYPGTTRDVVLPLLKTSGLEIGRDFFFGV